MFNERKYAEEIEKEIITSCYGVLKKGISLAKLFIERGMSDEEIYKDFCKRFIVLDESYNILVKKTKINIMISAAKKNPLLKEKNILFCKKEIDFIHSFQNIKFEKILFSLFCIMKFNDSNSFYLNNQELLRISNENKNSKYYDNVLKYLITNKLFSCKESKINGCLGKIVFIPSDYILNLFDNIEIFEISDYRNLGYRYESIVDKNMLFTNCEICDCIIPKKSNRQKYCEDCAKKINIKKTIVNKNKIV